MSYLTGATRLLHRPEIGAFSGMILVLVLFGVLVGEDIFGPVGVRNTSAVVSQLGIIAVAACLLMVAGEFDLSIGSMIGFSGMCMALLMKYGLHIGPIAIDQVSSLGALLITLSLTLPIGALIGTLVVRTRLPSFIVSLSFLFILRGATEVVFRKVHGSTAVGQFLKQAPDDSGFWGWLNYDAVNFLFGGDILVSLFAWLHDIGWNVNRAGDPAVPGLNMVVVWWLVIAGLGMWVLGRTWFGNWIYAAGGDAAAARSVGVRVSLVKVSMFVFSAFCATIYAATQVYQFDQADAAKGLLTELDAIAVAVVGGALLTGGYGTIAGVMAGAVLFGLVRQGFFYLPWIDGSMFRIFVGSILFVFVFFNDEVRKRVTGGY